MYNHLRIDVVAARSIRTCAHCNEEFEVGHFRVTKMRTWHLDCFRPDFPTKIELSRDVELIRGAAKYKDKIDEWIRLWNEADLLDEKKLSKKFFKNSVKETRTPQKRLLLEVFKFLSAPELERTSSLVCKQWHTISRSDELWLHLFDFRFGYNRSESLIATSFRSEYIKHHFLACWRCGRIVEKAKVKYVCPYFRQPLCVNCGEEPDCLPVTMNDVRSELSIPESLVQTLGVPFFQFGKSRCTYLCLAKEKLSQYRSYRKRWLLDLLEKDRNLLTPSELCAVREMDVSKQASSFRYCESERLKWVREFVEGCRKAKKDQSPELSLLADYKYLTRRLKSHLQLSKVGN